MTATALPTIVASANPTRTVVLLEQHKVTRETLSDCATASSKPREVHQLVCVGGQVLRPIRRIPSRWPDHCCCPAVRFRRKQHYQILV